MASSFVSQVPGIINIISRLKPQTILDIGKGFGKYGFLIHEYVGIDNSKKIDPSKKMKDQSNIKIDAVEVDPDLMLPHLDQFYNQIHFGDVLKLYKQLPVYDLIIMVDIIEHIPKAETIPMLAQFLKQGSKILISTPIDFFEQHLYESEYENHVSHWTKKDFIALGELDVQYYDAGAVYLLSSNKVQISGYGNSLKKKIKRIGRAILNEL
jgi:SAM-dependent methyltransferase